MSSEVHAALKLLFCYPVQPVVARSLCRQAGLIVMAFGICVGPSANASAQEPAAIKRTVKAFFTFSAPLQKPYTYFNFYLNQTVTTTVECRRLAGAYGNVFIALDDQGGVATVDMPTLTASASEFQIGCDGVPPLTIPGVSRTITLGKRPGDAYLGQTLGWSGSSTVNGVYALVDISCLGLPSGVPCNVAQAGRILTHLYRDTITTQPRMRGDGDYRDSLQPRCRVLPLTPLNGFRDPQRGALYPAKQIAHAETLEDISTFASDDAVEALRNFGFTRSPMVEASLENKITTYEDYLVLRGLPRPQRTSGYRPAPYQRHFWELNEKTLEFREAFKDPEQERLCQDIVMQVEAEKNQHRLRRIVQEKTDMKDAQGNWIYKAVEPAILQLVAVKRYDSAHAKVNAGGEPEAVAMDMNGSADGDVQSQIQAGLIGLWQPYSKDPGHYEDATGTTRRYSFEWQIASPLDVLVTDPSGRRVGFEWTTGTTYNELGERGFFTGRGTEPALIRIDDVIPGDYTLQAIGTGVGPYTIRISRYEGDGAESGDVRVFTGTAGDGVQLLPIVATVPTGEADVTPPIVTAPSAVTVVATEPGGARGASVPALAAFLAGGSASDDRDPSPTREVPAVAGTSVTNDTLFPLGLTTVAFVYRDVHGNAGSADATVTVVADALDTTRPLIIAPSEVFADATSTAGAAVSYMVTVSDETDTNPSLSCAPRSGSVFVVGTTAVACDASDAAGNTAHVDFAVTVRPAMAEPPRIQFTGFFSPVDNAPAVNSVKAGSAVPMKFSLGGDFGLAVFAAGYPQARVTSCAASAPTFVIEETASAASSNLSYDSAAGRYTYVWKTDRAWVGSCRELQLLFKDGTTRSASFAFSK